MSKQRQTDLFSMLPKRNATTKGQIQGSVQSAVKKVKDSKKYQPAIVLPQYSVLRQRIILAQQLVKDGRLQKKDNYHTIQTEDHLKEVMEQIRETGMMIWDSEFDSLKYSEANLIGLSFTNIDTDQHYYVPFLHCDTRKNILPNQLTHKQFVDIAGDVFTNPKYKKVTHQYNACDNQVLAFNTGLQVRGQYWDTLLFMNAIDENHKDNSLKRLYVEFVLKEEGKEETFDKLFTDITFAFAPLDVAYVYACYDAERTTEVYKWQKKVLSASEYKTMLKHYIEVEAVQIEVVSGMQQRGLTINHEYAQELHTEYSKLLGELKADLDEFFLKNYGLSGINYKSSQQMATIIYDKLGCIPFSKGKDKAPDRGTGEEVVQKLVKKYPQFSILKKLLIYRGTAKLLDTYIVAIPAQVHKDGKLRGKFHSHGARTGRYSSSEPNLQNIPSHYNEDTKKDDSRIRGMFMPQEGYVWIAADYSQIEPRILAYRCDDPTMIEAYKTNKDLYSLMASQVYEVPYEDCIESAGQIAKERRSSVKSLLLGIMYGRQAPAIAQELGITIKEAQGFMENFFKQYPNIKNYVDETVRMGTLQGYTTTLYGRRRRLPGLSSPSEYVKLEAQRQGVNASIQGSSADITKKAMRDAFYDSWLTSNDCHLILTIHDEIVLEVPKDKVEDASRRIREVMIEATGDLATKMQIKCDCDVYELGWGLKDIK